MQNLPLVFVLSLATVAGCSGQVIMATVPDGGGSSGSTSGSGGSGSASSGTAGSGSVSSGSTGSGSVSSGSAGSGSTSSGAAGSGAVTIGPGTDGGPACFTDAVGANYKGCAVDADCAIKDHQTDCCGTTHTIGVSKALSSAYDACESAWVHHFPGCGCSANATTTDDGSGVTSLYPVTVHCLPTSAGGKTCQTTVSAGVCMTNADCAANRLCQFPEIAACSAKGSCLPPAGPTCPPGYVPGCACDGTEVNIAHCEIQHGYQTKPLRHQGACVDGG